MIKCNQKMYDFISDFDFVGIREGLMAMVHQAIMVNMSKMAIMALHFAMNKTNIGVYAQKMYQQ